VDAVRAGARDQPCGARAFPGAGGEDHRPCLDRLRAARTDGVQRQRARPVEGGDAGAYDGPGAPGRGDEASGVGGAGQEARPGAVAAMGTVAWHSPGLLLPVQDLDPGHAGGGQPGSRREPGGTGTDDQHVDLAYGGHGQPLSHGAEPPGPRSGAENRPCPLTSETWGCPRGTEDRTSPPAARDRACTRGRRDRSCPRATAGRGSPLSVGGRGLSCGSGGRIGRPEYPVVGLAGSSRAPLTAVPPRTTPVPPRHSRNPGTAPPGHGCGGAGRRGRPGGSWR
jgi:hypothetical protein